MYYDQNIWKKESKICKLEKNISSSPKIKVNCNCIELMTLPLFFLPLRPHDEDWKASTNKQKQATLSRLPINQQLLFWVSRDLVSITSPCHTIDKKFWLGFHRLRQKKKLYRSVRNHYQYLLLQKINSVVHRQGCTNQLVSIYILFLPCCVFFFMNSNLL